MVLIQLSHIYVPCILVTLLAYNLLSVNMECLEKVLFIYVSPSHSLAAGMSLSDSMLTVGTEEGADFTLEFLSIGDTDNSFREAVPQLDCDR